jgi:hypothetical protein
MTTTAECAADVKEQQCTQTGRTKEEDTACLRKALPNLSNLCKTAILAGILRSK